MKGREVVFENVETILINKKCSLHALMCAALSSSAFYTLDNTENKPYRATITKPLDDILTSYFVGTGDFILGREIKFEQHGLDSINVSISEDVLTEVFSISGTNTFDTTPLPMLHVGTWYKGTLTRDSLDDIVVEIVRVQNSVPRSKTIHVSMAGDDWKQTVEKLILANSVSARTVEQMNDFHGGHSAPKPIEVQPQVAA